MADLASPRMPSKPAGARGYESHYLTAVAPEGGRAVWIRYTNDKRPGEPARGRLWFTLFDRDASAPLARRTAATTIDSSTGNVSTVGIDEFTDATTGTASTTTADESTDAPVVGWARIGGSEIGPGRACGQLEEIVWQVAWQADAPELGYLPKGWLYDRRWPRSNGAALAPAATFAGRVKTAGGGRVDLDGWRGMVGHNWGADHADRWIWLHVTGLGARDEEGWLDMILARTRVGRWLTPWLPAGALQLGGARRPIGLGTGMRGLSVQVERERLAVALPQLAGGGLRLRARMPAQSTVEWDYQTPSGGAREVRNCSIASGTIELGGEPAVELDGRLAVEVGE